MALRGQVSCPNLDQIDWERKRGGKRANHKREGTCGSFRERSSTFSLEFPVIGLANYDEARSKVAPHSKGYAWVPVLRGFDKL